MLRKKLVSLFIISSFFSVNFINHGATAKVQPSNFFQHIPIVNNNQTKPTEAELPPISMNDPRYKALETKIAQIVKNAQQKYPGQDVSKIPEVQQQIVSVNQELRTIGVIVDATPQELIQDIVSPKPEENVSGVDPELQKLFDEANEFSNKSTREAVENFIKANPDKNPEDDPELQQKIIEINREYNRRIGRSDNDPSAVPPDNKSAVRMSIVIEASEINGINPVTGEPLTQPVTGEPLTQSELVLEAGDIAAQQAVTEITPAAITAATEASGLEPSTLDARQKAITDKTNNQGTGIEQSTLDARQKAITDKTNNPTMPTSPTMPTTTNLDTATQQNIEAARQRRIDLGMKTDNQGTGIEQSALDARQKAITDKTNNPTMPTSPTMPTTTNLDTATQQNIEAARQRRIDLGMEAETEPNISINKPVIPMTDKGGSLGVQLKEGQAQRETEAKGKINKPTVPDSQAVKDAKTIADAKALSNKTNVNRSVYLPNSSEEKELQAALARTGKEYPTVRDDYANKPDGPAKVSKDDSRKTEFDGDSDKPATISLNKKDKKQGERIELAKDVDGFYGEEGAGGSFAADKFTKAKDYRLGKAGTIKGDTEIPLSIAKDTKFPTSLPAGTFEEAQALADQLGANIPTTGNIVIPNPLTGALVSVPVEMATCLFSGGASCVGDAVKGLVADYAKNIVPQVFGFGASNSILSQAATGAVGGAVDGALNGGDIVGGIQSGAVGGFKAGLTGQVETALNGLTANAGVLSVAQQANTAAFGCMTQGQCNPTDMVKNAARGVVTNAAMGVATNAVNSGVSGLANTGRQVVGSENIGTVSGTPDQVLAWANGGERPKGSTKGMTGTAIR